MDSLTPVIIPSHTYVSDHDPNTQKNRIPTETELVLLKTLAKSHASLIEHLKEQVKTAQATHDAILARYQQQFRELEGTQSQLHESKKALQLMHGQCSALQAESNRLLGITHPIRRYPPDIIRCIFESTCDMVEGSNKIRAAIIFSHVCQRWRTIAHGTPRLWSQIHYRMENNSSGISSFWGHIIPKTKAVPVTIRIRNIEAGANNHLKSCHLAQISCIKEIDLLFTAPHVFNDLLTASGLFPKGVAQSMTLSCTKGDGAVGPDPVVTWDIGKLTEKLVSSTVVLDAPCILRITPSFQLTTITSLSLHQMQEVDVLLVLSLLNQLEDLRLHGVGILQPQATATQTISASLKLFLISTDDEEEPWLPLISCPSITSFHHSGPEFSEACIAFVALHVSILTLDYVSSSDLIPVLAPIAPQVQFLAIDPTNLPSLIRWSTNGALGPPFPLLKEINVSDFDIPMIKPDFEELVRMYCLPADGPGGGSLSLPAPVKLSILVDSKAGDSGTWRTSELYKQAKKVVSENGLWKKCQNMHLCWTN